MVRGKSEKEKNALNVRLELQADYYAGVWARYIEQENLLDVGDIEEALNAAHAVGDDTLQEQAYGYSVPDSLHTEVRSNVCVGSNVVTNTAILNTVTPSVYLIKTFRKTLKVFLSD